MIVTVAGGIYVAGAADEKALFEAAIMTAQSSVPGARGLPMRVVEVTRDGIHVVAHVVSAGTGRVFAQLDYLKTKDGPAGCVLHLDDGT
jgi:hypothetical protein